MPDPAAELSSTNDPRSSAFVDAFSAYLTATARIDELALKRAEKAQRQSGERFDVVLTRLGLVPETDMAQLLAAALGLDHIAPGRLEVLPPWPDGVPPDFFATHAIVPIDADGAALTVAVADPFKTEAIAALAFLLDRPVVMRVTTLQEVERLLRLGGGATAATGPVVTEAPAASADASGEDDARRLADLASEAPVIRLVHDLIARAVTQQASDIHIEPTDDALRVRFRIDGLLHTVERLSPALRAAVTSRVKVMANLDIAERRLPQDGRLRTVVRGREIDLRVSTMPTLPGESVVLRILDRSSVQLDFAALGFSEAALPAFRRLLESPHGMILVTGPTGSGKTTTLYTALRQLNREDNKTFTVEDPIEYQLAGVNQIQTHPRIGLTFAHALRSILRQDPDVVMVGEIRDLETAEIAIQASLTGHLVLSTVHTNSAAGTVIRLIDMGTEDFLLASSLRAVLAQRLVRRLCPSCSEPADIGPALEARLARAPRAVSKTANVRRAVGCPACRQTGYRGRSMICELLVVDDAQRAAIVENPTERKLEAVAIDGGMVTMFEDGLSRVLGGETTLEEVLRVTQSV
jgi:general secretion pathway protein E